MEEDTMFPEVWSLLKERIREHPNEARQVDEGDGSLPIQDVLWLSAGRNEIAAAPVSCFCRRTFD
jgi:hypothetical protein